MDEYYKVKTEDGKTHNVYRFPHEEEQRFIEFISTQYRAAQIIRASDGVIVYQKEIQL
jgi:hypothetical protein